MPYTKINSKWTKDLNVRPKRIKLLEENIAQKLHDTGFGNNSLHITPKAQAIKENIDNLNPLKIKNFVHQRHYLQNKRQPTQWENISASYIFDKKYAE